MRPLRISRYGPQAVLITLSDQVDDKALAGILGAQRAVEAAGWEGLKEATSAYGSLLLEFHDEASPPPRGEIEAVLAETIPLELEETPIFQIPVCYDGPDLEALATRNGLAASDVVEIHTSGLYRVYMLGFSPGFPYLGPLDPRLHAPRLDTPRTRVPAGSVAIGGGHTGIYSTDSPGGWWLIGQTSHAIFSREAAVGTGSPDAFLLRQGDRVRFSAI